MQRWLLPIAPYDPAAQGNPLHAEAPAAKEQHSRDRITWDMVSVDDLEHSCQQPIVKKKY